jgi:NADH:ubiquinone oxidoreductase subunit E
MEVTGWHLGIPQSEVFGAATSYSELRIEPLPKTLLRICDGLACDSNEREKLKEILQTKFDANSDVEIEMIPCAFLCALAPAVQVNGKWIGRANMDKISDVMSNEG